MLLFNIVLFLSCYLQDKKLIRILLKQKETSGMWRRSFEQQLV